MPRDIIKKVRNLAAQSNKSSAERCCDFDNFGGSNAGIRLAQNYEPNLKLTVLVCETPCFWISWCPYFVKTEEDLNANPICCLHPTVAELKEVSEECCSQFQLCDEKSRE